MDRSQGNYSLKRRGSMKRWSKKKILFVLVIPLLIANIYFYLDFQSKSSSELATLKGNNPFDSRP